MTVTTANVIKHRLMYDILNGTYDGNTFLYLLTTAGDIVVFDTKLMEEVSHTHLFPHNILKSNLFYSNNRLFIHRQNESFIQLYNVTYKKEIMLVDQFNICNTLSNGTIYRYQLYSRNNLADIMCGVGEGQDSEWRYGVYTMVEPKEHAPIFRWSQLGVVILVVVVILSIQKLSKNQKLTKRQERQIEE